MMTDPRPEAAARAPLDGAFAVLVAEALREVLPDLLREVMRRELPAVLAELDHSGEGPAGPRFVSIDEAATRLSISRDLVYRVLQHNPALRVKAGSRTLVRWPEIADWMAAERVIEGRVPTPMRRRAKMAAAAAGKGG